VHAARIEPSILVSHVGYKQHFAVAKDGADDGAAQERDTRARKDIGVWTSPGDRHKLVGWRIVEQQPTGPGPEDPLGSIENRRARLLHVQTRRQTDCRFDRRPLGDAEGITVHGPGTSTGVPGTMTKW
jgi:hypothetical protein